MKYLESLRKVEYCFQKRSNKGQPLPVYVEITLQNNFKYIGGEVSKLQYQLKSILPSLSSQARSLKDQAAKERYYLLKAVAFSKKDIKKTCESRGRSTTYFYKWAERLVETECLESLRTESRAPKYSPNKVDPRVEKRICRLRRKYPYKGPEQLLHELRKKNLKKLPHVSTVYQVLLRNDLIKEEYKKTLSKKHLKRYRRPYPGYLQMDFKYVPYAINGEQYYQLSCIDHHSNWRMIRNYKTKCLGSVMDFLEELKLNCPFYIYQIQTDNDKAFTDKYRINTDGHPTGKHPLDYWCKQHDIEHKLIPIGKKELNGKVENSHKWDDREFYSQIHPRNFHELEQQTRAFNGVWNYTRATAVLGWQTPMQRVYAYQFMRRFVNIMLGEKLQTQGRKKILLKPKKEDYVSRYLKYMDGEEAIQRNSSMYPNYSLVRKPMD